MGFFDKYKLIKPAKKTKRRNSMYKKTQIALLIKSVTNTYLTTPDIDHKTAARAIGTMIYDIPTTFSGLVSTSLINEHGYRPSKSKCCAEHFHSRQEAAVKIMQMIERKEDFLPFLDECTTIHLTTSEENHMLSKVQNSSHTKNLSLREQYELCGIKLVRDPGTMPRKLQNQLLRG